MKMAKFKVITDALKKYPRKTILINTQDDLYGRGNEKVGEDAIPLSVIQSSLGMWFEEVEEEVIVSICSNSLKARLIKENGISENMDILFIYNLNDVDKGRALCEKTLRGEMISDYEIKMIVNRFFKDHNVTSMGKTTHELIILFRQYLSLL